MKQQRALRLHCVNTDELKGITPQMAALNALQ